MPTKVDINFKKKTNKQKNKNKYECVLTESLGDNLITDHQNTQ